MSASTSVEYGGGGDPASSGHDEVNVARHHGSGGDSEGTNTKKVSVRGKGEVADNTDLMDPAPQDPLDKGATAHPSTNDQILVDDDGLSTGATPVMRFPLLDVEPNSITSTNTDEWTFTLVPRVKKPTIDHESLAYESIVGNLSGHKRAYNSTKYGELSPEIDISFYPKNDKRKVWRIDSESLQESLADAPFGFRKANKQLADDFKSSMRTYVMANSHYHGGPTMLKRGLNQYRNAALRKKAEDPNPQTVEPAIQTARDAFVLNDKILYANTNTKLQFKTNANAARIPQQSTNSADIPPPTDWFGGGYADAAQRTLGFGSTSTDNYTLQNIPRGVLPPSHATAPLMGHAPSQPNSGIYATHRTSAHASVAPSVPTAENTMGR